MARYNEATLHRNYLASNEFVTSTFRDAGNNKQESVTDGHQRLHQQKGLQSLNPISSTTGKMLNARQFADQSNRNCYVRSNIHEFDYREELSRKQQSSSSMAKSTSNLASNNANGQPDIAYYRSNIDERQLEIDNRLLEIDNRRLEIENRHLEIDKSDRPQIGNYRSEEDDLQASFTCVKSLPSSNTVYKPVYQRGMNVKTSNNIQPNEHLSSSSMSKSIFNKRYQGDVTNKSLETLHTELDDKLPDAAYTRKTDLTKQYDKDINEKERFKAKNYPANVHDRLDSPQYDLGETVNSGFRRGTPGSRTEGRYEEIYDTDIQQMKRESDNGQSLLAGNSFSNERAHSSTRANIEERSSNPNEIENFIAGLRINSAINRLEPRMGDGVRDIYDCFLDKKQERSVWRYCGEIQSPSMEYSDIEGMDRQSNEKKDAHMRHALAESRRFPLNQSSSPNTVFEEHISGKKNDPVYLGKKYIGQTYSNSTCNRFHSYNLEDGDSDQDVKKPLDDKCRDLSHTNSYDASLDHSILKSVSQTQSQSRYSVSERISNNSERIQNRSLHSQAKPSLLLATADDECVEHSSKGSSHSCRRLRSKSPEHTSARPASDIRSSIWNIPPRNLKQKTPLTQKLSPSRELHKLSPPSNIQKLSPSRKRQRLSPFLSMQKLSPLRNPYRLSSPAKRQKLSPYRNPYKISLSSQTRKLSPSRNPYKMDSLSKTARYSPPKLGRRSPKAKGGGLSSSRLVNRISPSLEFSRMSPLRKIQRLSPHQIRKCKSPLRNLRRQSPLCTNRSLSPPSSLARLSLPTSDQSHHLLKSQYDHSRRRRSPARRSPHNDEKLFSRKKSVSPELRLKSLRTLGRDAHTQRYSQTKKFNKSPPRSDRRQPQIFNSRKHSPVRAMERNSPSRLIRSRSPLRRSLNSSKGSTSHYSSRISPVRSRPSKVSIHNQVSNIANHEHKRVASQQDAKTKNTKPYPEQQLRSSLSARLEPRSSGSSGTAFDNNDQRKDITNDRIGNFSFTSRSSASNKVTRGKIDANVSRRISTGDRREKSGAEKRKTDAKYRRLSAISPTVAVKDSMDNKHAGSLRIPAAYTIDVSRLSEERNAGARGSRFSKKDSDSRHSPSRVEASLTSRGRSRVTNEKQSSNRYADITFNSKDIESSISRQAANLKQKNSVEIQKASLQKKPQTVADYRQDIIKYGGDHKAAGLTSSIAELRMLLVDAKERHVNKKLEELSEIEKKTDGTTVTSRKVKSANSKTPVSGKSKPKPIVFTAADFQ